MISFTVPGRPRPKGRPRVTKNGTYTDPVTAAYQKSIRLIAATHIKRPLMGDVELGIMLYFADKAHGDGDNVFKAVADSLNNMGYIDDKQIKRGVWEIRYIDTSLSSKQRKQQERTEVTLDYYRG